MFAINPLLFLLACLAGVAHSYSDPGAYERILFYYAYMVDAQINNGTPQTIGTSCSRIKQVKKGQLCSLNQFVSFITNKDEVNVFDGVYPKMPPLASTAAKILPHSDLTGPVVISRIHINGNGWSYDKLLGNVASFVGNKSFGNKVDPNISGEALQCMKVVRELRVAATHNTFVDKVAKPAGWKIEMGSERKVGDISVGTRVDPLATVSNPDNRSSGMTRTSFIAAFSEHVKGGHLENIEALRSVINDIEKDHPTC